MVGRQKEKLEKLYLIWIDKISIAETMRRNLASDIIAGYGVRSVLKQMLMIEEYEESAVAKSEKDYNEYAILVGITLADRRKLEQSWKTSN